MDGFVAFGGESEVLVGFAQHGYGVPVLRVRKHPGLDEPVYYPPCSADPDLALVVTSGDLGNGAVTEATRLYLRESGEWGAPGNVEIARWVEAQAGEGQLVFLAPAGEVACVVAECTG